MPRFIEGEPYILKNFSSDRGYLFVGMKYVISIYENTTVYNKLGAKLVVTIPEMCNELEYRSDDFWECYIRFFTGTIWHPVGTCRMGTDINNYSGKTT